MATKTKQIYIEKYLRDRGEHIFSNISPIHQDCIVCIVIPAYNESHLDKTLASLNKAMNASKKSEVIIVNNIRQKASDEAQENFNKIKLDVQQYASFSPIHCINVQFRSDKKAGVGLARKIGMDTALYRLTSKGTYDGLIVCLDADCTVAPNYIDVLEKFYLENPKSVAASIHFEHPITPYDPKEGIYQYELHLRYFIQCQRNIGLPYAYHTVGSSMLVRASQYAKVGGMNTRKAGEDFYFLHKFTLDKSFYEINNTTVFPSSRQSDRVPFGTGRAMMNFKGELLSYAKESFDQLFLLINGLDQFYHSESFENWINKLNLDPFVRDYFSLRKEYFLLARQNANSYRIFEKHFYTWFNPFQLMKYLHYCRDERYPNEPILKLTEQNMPLSNRHQDPLTFYRKWNNAQWSADRMGNEHSISAS